MKKLILGIVLGATLSGVTVSYATEIKTYLFPSHFYINGNITPLDPEYEVLNYNGHAYVPVRFVAEKMGAYVGYDNTNHANSITINYFPKDKEVLADTNTPQVHAGIINLYPDGDATVIAGLLSIDVTADPQDINYNVSYELSFYDKDDKLIATYNYDTAEKPIKNKEIKYTYGSVIGDVTHYNHATLKVKKFSKVE